MKICKIFVYSKTYVFSENQITVSQLTSLDDTLILKELIPHVEPRLTVLRDTEQ